MSTVERADKIDFDLNGIGQLLDLRYLAVPEFQRPYSWQDNQISEFWDDLYSAITDSRSAYFLGTIVLTANPTTNRFEIIDGQQRLATTTLLMAVIRNSLNFMSQANDVEFVSNHFIATRRLGSSDPTPKLVLGPSDEIYFRKLVNSNTGTAAITKSSSESHRLVRKAFDHFAVKFSNLLQVMSEADGIQAAHRWIQFLQDQVQVMVITVPDEADAFLIFETLNDRGLDLNMADLIKNHLFRLSGDRLEAVKKCWYESEARVNGVGDRKSFIDFLRHDWTSRHGLVRERDLFKDIRRRLSTQSAAVDAAESFRDSSQYYAALLSRDDEFWTDKGTGTKSDIDTLQRLRIEQTRPLLLVAMQRFSKQELKRTIRAIVSWSVRSIVTGGAGSGRTEKAYADAAVAVMESRITTCSALFAQLDPIVPADADFEAGFQRIRPIARLARYYLLALERQTIGSSEPELIPNSDEDQVNLEHVLPKRAQRSEWISFSSQEIKDMTDRLGNIALLQRSSNSSIGNKPFLLKQPVFAQSKLELTSMIGSIADWSPDSIDQRQSELAALAVLTWPREP